MDGSTEVASGWKTKKAHDLRLRDLDLKAFIYLSRNEGLTTISGTSMFKVAYLKEL